MPPLTDRAAKGVATPSEDVLRPAATMVPPASVTCSSAALAAPDGSGSSIDVQFLPFTDVHAAGALPCVPTATKPPPGMPATTASISRLPLAPSAPLSSAGASSCQLVMSLDHQAAASAGSPGSC